MAFKIGSNTVIDNSSVHRSLAANVFNTANGTYQYAFPSNYLLTSNNTTNIDFANAIRYTTYTDDYKNCRGYLPNGNCLSNPQYTVPNGNWWTWGVSGIGAGLCGNPGGYDFAGGTTSAYYAVSVNLVYDAYYELYNRVRGSEQHRGYSHCNCNSGFNSVGNCYTNCNCNCACACDCACACAC
mgnify:FL=1|jgi:hypothetical protein